MTRKLETRRPKKTESRQPGNHIWAATMVCGWLSESGFRISDLFRPSAFGLRLLALLAYLTTSFPTLAAEPNGTSDLPPSSLRPPRAEIPPSFWEQYGMWLILGAVLVLAAIASAIWLLIRTKPPAPVPHAVQARQELETLQQQPEDGALLSRTSQILRRYIAAVFAFPSGELTTSEFCQALLRHQHIGSELCGEISEFLRVCDLRKFAPAQPETPIGAVVRALKIIERSESRLGELERLADAATADQGAKPPPQAGRTQGMASGS